jgi:RNA polymerase sigma-70 factor (ECF subfamily)
MSDACATTMTMDEAIETGPSAERELLSLVRSVLDGDRDGAERLWAAVRPRLLRIALALGADPDSAPDTVQESLWAAHRNLHRFDASRSSFTGWLGVILVRRLRNRRRAAARRRRLLAALRLVPSARSDAGRSAVEARLTVERLLHSLTERQREVVALYEIGELGAAEVALVLDLTPAGVRSIARDARRRLADAARDERRRGAGTEEAGS